MSKFKLKSVLNEKFSVIRAQHVSDFHSRSNLCAREYERSITIKIDEVFNRFY